MENCKRFVLAFGFCVNYWTLVLSKLNKPLQVTPPQLIEGFWPCHDCRVVEDKISCLRCLSLLHMDVIPKDEELESYCGLANKVPKIPFNLWLDI